MARKAKRSRRTARTPAPRPAPSARVAESNREKAIEAFLSLLTEHRFEDIGMAQIASEAELSLAELREEFASTLAIFAAHTKEMDREVLAGVDPEMAEETPRERLFDVMMRRLEILAPHKEAVRSLLRSASFNPGLGLALNSLAVRSMQWMLTAADIDASGPRGMMRAQGLALLYASVLRTWVNDEDRGLARTLAALDRELARGQRLAGLLDELYRIPQCARAFVERARRPRRGRPAREAA